MTIERSIRSSTDRIGSIKTLSKIELESGSEERSISAAVIVKRPDKIRLDAMDQLADVWASLGTDGKLMWLYLPSKGKLYSGKAGRTNMLRLAEFDWDLNELVSVLMGLVPVSEASSFSEVKGRGEKRFVVLPEGISVWMNKKRGLPARCVKGEGIDIVYEVNFSDYRKVKEVFFPFKIEAVFPNRNVRITIDYQDVAIGDDIDDVVFSPPVHRGLKKVRLKD